MSDTTMKSNLIIPEVMGSLVDEAFGERSALLPLATRDMTLSGTPGDTLKFPAFRYIGKAEEVAENGEVSPGILSADTVSVTVKKYAKAVRITDEARLSGLGEPLQEAARQLAQSIDHAVDDALFERLSDAGYARKYPVAALTSDGVADALALFGEDLLGDKVLLTDAQGYAALRKDPAYIRSSDIGQRVIMSGVVGEIWGCQILVSDKIKEDPETREKQYFILKPGALRLVSKTQTQVEVQREASHMRDTVYASKHCAAYLYDASRVASLCQFTGLQALPFDCGIGSVSKGVGKTALVIPDELAAPQGLKWVYLLDDIAANKGVFGTAITGTSDWQGNEALISTGGKIHIHILLVDKESMKPLKTLTLETQEG
ncbi:MAG: N4-gp56 family major capsid protein [Eubacteriales bacterium]|nr:N4-gp56 family major capsid protein [Eubacteriales bacterium]